MKTKTMTISLVCVLLVLSNLGFGGGEVTNLGIGFKAGLNRLEGDISNLPFKPFVYGSLDYNLFWFLSVGAEAGYSIVGGKIPNDLAENEFKTVIIPYEGHMKFSFLPLGKVNPYVIIGGGGFYWNYTINDTTPRYATTGRLKKGYDSFFKSGAGVEIALNRNHSIYFNLGATFRYSLTDMLDDVHSDELGHRKGLNDGLFDFHGGFTFYFRTSTRGDRDNDGVPDELDLAIDIKEDPDGYMDHDGKPEDNPLRFSRDMAGKTIESVEDDVDPPIVIHYPVRRVEEGQDIVIKTDIYENFKLKTASIIYRPIGLGAWKVGQLRPKYGALYEGIIPGRYVRKQGVEYCVIAIDEAISGVGYSGLPKLPIRVEVISNPKAWRIISGAAALIGWGGAGYLMLKNQN
ncbi:MAG TPA: hypothetical protein ENN22_05850 [bacterium]|nr:hypothetical protein [bacterium]